MKVPIIIKENSNIFFFHTIQDAAEYLESVNLRNQKHVIYNAEGTLLEVLPSGPPLTIIQLEGAENKAGELKLLLKGYLKLLGLDEKWIEQSTLAELVDYCAHHCIAKSA